MTFNSLQNLNVGNIQGFSTVNITQQSAVSNNVVSSNFQNNNLANALQELSTVNINQQFANIPAISNITVSNINYEKFTIFKYINDDFSKNDNNIDLLYLINKNNIKSYNEDQIQNLFRLKSEIINKVFSESETCFNKILKIQNNIDFINSTLNNKITTIENTYSNFINLINLRNKNINLLKFSNIMFESFIKNSQSIHNNLITNYFFESKNKEKNNLIQKENNKFNIVNKNKRKNNLNLNSDSFMFLTNIKLTDNEESISLKDETGIITQAFINLANQLFFVNENVLYENFENNIFYDFAYEDKINIINNKKDFKIQDFVNYNKSDKDFNINLTEILNKNKEISTKNFNKFSFNNRSLKLLNDRDYESTRTFIDEELKNLTSIESLYITKKIEHFSRSYDFIVNDFIYKKRSAKEINKLYSGDALNANLALNNPNENITIEQALLNIGNNLNILTNTNEIKINLSIENNDELNSHIYFNKSNIFIKDNVYDDRLKKTKNNISINNNFKSYINNNSTINDIEYLLTADKLVKRIKLKNINNLNINIDIFNEIHENIKYSNNKNYILSYIDEDNENISLCNKNNILFNTLFTKQNDNFYSNFSLNTNDNVYKNNYLNIEYNDAVNNQFKETKLNIKKLFSNYIDNNIFMSTSTFIKDIVKSTKDCIETTENVEAIQDIIKTNELYFSYLFGVEVKDEVKNLIIKRFIKKALTLSKNASIFLKTNLLSEFSYDIEKYKEKDYEKTSKKSIEKYLDDILNTSESLKLISENVFSKQNITNISKKYNFDLTKLLDTTYETNLESENIQTLLVSHVFPFVNKLKYYNDDFYFKLKDQTNNIYNISYKNQIKVINEFNTESQQQQTKYIIDKNSFDITNKKQISTNVILSNSNIDLNDINLDLSKYCRFTIEDKFENSCNSKHSIFNVICDKIINIIEYTVKDFNNKQFNNEKDIDDFIEKNKVLYEHVFDLLYLFKPFNDLINKKFINYSMFKSFNIIDKFIEKEKILSNNDLIKNVGQIQRLIKDNLTNGIRALFPNNNNDFNNSNIIDVDIVFDILKKEINNLYISFSDEQTFIDNIKTEVFDDKSSFYNVFYSIYKKACLSDFSLLVNADIINSAFDISNDIFQNKNKLIDEKLINIAQTVGFDLNFINNNFYLNQSLKKMQNIIINNTEIKNRLIDDVDLQNKNQFYLNNNLFDEIKNKEKYIIPQNINSILNSDVFGFCISNSNLRKINDVSKLIKLTIHTKDISNSNKVYLPKTYLFSTNISDLNINSTKYPKFCEKYKDNNFYLLFNNLSNNIDQIVFYLNELKLRQFNNINNPIILKINDYLNKFKITNETNLNTIYDFIIDCHINSNKISNLLHLIHDINFNNINLNYTENISEQIINALNENQVIDIFGNNFNESFVFNKTKNNINNLLSLENNIDYLKDNEIYDVYHVNYDNDDQYFILLDENIDKNDFEQVVLSQKEKIISNVFQDINLNTDTFVYKEKNKSKYNNNIIKNIMMEFL